MTETLIRSSADWATLFRRRAIERGLSHRKVDVLAHLPDGYFSKIAAGKKVPGGEIILRLCAALRIERIDLRLVEKSEG
jgi:hypothetical protein